MTNGDDTDSVIELRPEGQMPFMACVCHEVDGYQETMKEQGFLNVEADPKVNSVILYSHF